MLIITAGGIVTKMIDKQLHFLIIQKKVDDTLYWEFPKGKLEEGEDLSDCAVREVFEETGVNCLVNTLIDKVEGQKKIIYLFDMKPIYYGVFIPTDKIVACKWVTYKDLRKYVKQNLYKLFILKNLKEYYYGNGRLSN